MIRSQKLSMRNSAPPICPFCHGDDIRHRVVARNEHAWAFPTNSPIVPGHILICPVRCVPSVDDLYDDELLAMFELRREIKNALRNVFGAQGFNFAWNDARVAGQTVRHLHLHIVPRHEGDTGIAGYDPRVFLYRPGSRAESPQEELLEVAGLVSGAMLGDKQKDTSPEAPRFFGQN